MSTLGFYFAKLISLPGTAQLFSFAQLYFLGPGSAILPFAYSSKTPKFGFASD